MRTRTGRASAHGVTLMEALVAMATMATIATIGLRMVFLADRAMGRELEAGERVAAILSLAAQLRDDTQLTESIRCPSANEVRLQTPEGTVTYLSGPDGTARRIGAEERLFANVRADFTGTTDDLLKARLTDAAGASVDLAVARRNAPIEAEKEEGE